MSNRQEYIVRRMKNAIIYNPGTPHESRHDGWELVRMTDGERIGPIHPTEKRARFHANKLTQSHEHPILFVDTKINAMLRYLLRAQDWVHQAELSRVYGVGEYGRSDLYHRQAGDKRWIQYRDLDTGRIGKPRQHWRDGVTPGQPILRREWRWNLGTIEDYFKLLTNDQLAAAFIFCEDGMTGQVRGKTANGQWYLKQGSYNEGGRVFTSQDQWGVWAQYANNEINRRGHK